MKSAFLILTLLAVAVFVLAGCSDKTSGMSFEEFKSKRKALMAKNKTTMDCLKCKMTGKLQCWECKGTGKWVCDKCKGTGEVTCKSCKGTGLFACWQCKGTGKDRSGGECGLCKGVGGLRCSVCSNIRSDHKDYRQDQKSDGIHPCNVCLNNMRARDAAFDPDRQRVESSGVCSRCGGKGASVCGECEGTGKQVEIKPPTLAEWIAEFGEPTKKQEIDHRTYYYYECKEGLIQMQVYMKGGESPSAELMTWDPDLY